MKERILALMKEQYKHLGLPTEILEFQSGLLAGQVSDESEIADKVSALSDIFGVLQSAIDKRANEAVDTYKKKNPPKGEDGGEKGEGVSEELMQQIAELSKKVESLSGFKTEIDTLKESVNIAKKNQRLAERNELIAKIAEDLGLDAELTELAKLRLTDDMDDEAIDKSMCESKKLFLSKGLVAEDGKITDREAALKQEADNWVSSLAK